MYLSLSLSLYLSLSLSLSIFFGHIMSSQYSEQMSQRSQVSRIGLRRCSQNIFVFVFVVVFVFVFDIAFVFSHAVCYFQIPEKCEVTRPAARPPGRPAGRPEVNCLK